MRRVTLLLLALGLLSATDALGQSPAPQTVQVQTCVIVLTPYGLMPVCTSQPVDANELERRASEYMTNGASVFAVPTAGPAGDYFHDGARYWAMPTTSWVPTFPAAAGSAAPLGSARTRPPPAPSSVLPAVVAAPVESSSAPPAAASDAGSESPEADGAPATEETPPLTPSTTEASPSSAQAGSTNTTAAPPASPPPSRAAAVATTSSPPETPAPPTTLALGTGHLVHGWWAWVVAAVVSSVALLFFVGSRLGERLRLRWR
ncbi:MAG: hypothetical protein ABSE49_14040 [Polyangiaceae bacterium]|jgi:hypothetical protein